MARARITLQGSKSHTGRGRTFKQGQAQTVTSNADILYYQGQPGFAVQMLDAPATKPAAPPAVTPTDEPVVHTRPKLEALTKAKLVEVAAEMELLLEGDELKAEMVNAILSAQDGDADGDADDDAEGGDEDDEDDEDDDDDDDEDDDE